jgi:conjugative relaxase-like TrwC/TraI family protein
MLRLYKVEPQRLDYYLTVTATESVSPFFESDGYWLGKGKVSGPVARNQLVEVVLGRDHATGGSLNPYQSRVRFCAFDATFAAPKTVSVLHALGDPEVRSAIEMSHRRSVQEVMQFVARRLIVVSRGQGDDRILMRGSSLPQAVFEHRTSRSLDPHLHSHVLVPNVATADGKRWSALDARPIFVHAALLGSLYRASLRRQLSIAAGVCWREIRPGWYDVVGLSPPMIRLFSHRSSEIFAEMTRQGYTSSKAAAITSARLRVQRDLTLGYDELRARWQQRAFRAGISPSRLQEMTGGRQPEAEEHARRQSDAIRANARHGQTVSGMLRGVADQLREGVNVRDVETDIDHAVQSGAIVAPTDLWPFGPRGSHRSGPKRTRDDPNVWSSSDLAVAGRFRGFHDGRLRDDDYALSI